ncbi:unnamed protein product [Phytophthora lilii]|uniref:Unnamed protein product n=1 Tax=Phytophthora lilii TaxID=2077276 RepID=A0A9W6TI61_9STRA|nr:unnamed protein product [Phytophthora lilii]
MAPPTPARPPAPAIRGPARRQPPPVQTPECTTRTLAFDSAASSAAADEDARARKRRRRVAQAAAFITARRPLNTEQDEQDEQDAEQDRMWTRQDAVRLPTHAGVQQEDTREALKPPLTNRKSLETAVLPEQDERELKRQNTVNRLRILVKSCSQQHHAASALFYADKLVREGSTRRWRVGLLLTFLPSL